MITVCSSYQCALAWAILLSLSASGCLAGTPDDIPEEGAERVTTSEQALTSTTRCDFDQNGTIDIVWRNTSTGANEVWFMNGTQLAGWAVLPSENPNSGWSIVGTGDFNQNGTTDLLWRNTSNGGNIIWLMTGTAYASSISLPSRPINWTLAATGDFNGDNHVDILWRNEQTGVNEVWLMNYTSNVGTMSIPSVAPASGWKIVGTGDFNNDRATDIIWRNTQTGNNSFWMMNFNGTISSTAPLQWENPYSGWKIVGTGDFNGDGWTDILWRNTTNGSNEIWPMAGTSPITWIPLQSEPINSGWQIVGPK
jgi:hypothetical protein